MKNTEDQMTDYQESKSFNFILSKSENDLFDEARNNLADVWRINRFETKKSCGWNLFKNQDLLLEIKEYRLSKKEQNFLKTSEGFSFLLNQAKQNIESVSELKKCLSKHLKGV